MDGCIVRRGQSKERGFTYIALLIFIAIMSVGLVATGEIWNTSIKREKEQELLFVGNQIRNAIFMYYNHTPGQSGRYPTSLEDLLKDPRSPATKRYLRKLYPDPMTNSSNWELVTGPNGEIFGVHSSSGDEPLKKSDFSFADRGCEGKTKYSDWVFMITARYVPPPSVKNTAGSPVRRTNQ